MADRSAREIKAGDLFGRLTAVSSFRRRVGHKEREHWRCRCSCGNEARVAKIALLSGKTRSCGCLGREKVKEMVERRREGTGIRPGGVYGRLTVVEMITVAGLTRWRCLCACGTEVLVAGAYKLLRGATRSCGCLRKDVGHRMGFGFSPGESRQRGKHAAMVKCGNCTQDFDPAKGGIIASEKGRVAAGVCGDCVEGTAKVKLVLSRGEVGGFAYYQYSCLETRKAAR